MAPKRKSAGKKKAASAKAPTKSTKKIAKSTRKATRATVAKPAAPAPAPAPKVSIEFTNFHPFSLSYYPAVVANLKSSFESPFAESRTLSSKEGPYS